jgi:hypothetical protein
VTASLFSFGKFVLGMMVLLAAASSFPVRSQSGEENSQPVLVDEFSLVGDCEFGGRLDSFLVELTQRPGSHGYIINYKGTDELPEQRGANPRETAISNHISFRNFDAVRITVVRGGYRPQVMTELWVVPPGANPPEPSKTVAAPVIPEHSTFLFAKGWLEADGTDLSLDDFVLPAVKEREAAEFAETANESEVPESVDTPESVPNAEAESAQSPDDAEPYVDDRTAEEKEAERFAWADVGVAEFISKRKGSSGVIFFYADDERFDTAKLRQFVQAGRDRLAESSSIKASRLRVVFGGYREVPEVEFWFVPAKGKDPLPKPAARPVPEPEDTAESSEVRP